jgi:hypothetical protein
MTDTRAELPDGCMRDSEIEIRRKSALEPPVMATTLALIARIDYERSRADAAEARVKALEESAFIVRSIERSLDEGYDVRLDDKAMAKMRRQFAALAGKDKT